MRKAKNFVYICVLLFVGVHIAFRIYYKCNMKSLICTFSVVGGMLSLIEIVYSVISNRKEERIEIEYSWEMIKKEEKMLTSELESKYGVEAKRKLESIIETVGEEKLSILFDNIDKWLNVEIDDYLEECGLEDEQKREVMKYITDLKTVGRELRGNDEEEVDEEEASMLLQGAKESEENLIRRIDIVYLFAFILIPIGLLIGEYCLNELEKMADWLTVLGFFAVLISCAIKNNYRVKGLEELKRNRDSYSQE